MFPYVGCPIFSRQIPTANHWNLLQAAEGVEISGSLILRKIAGTDKESVESTLGSEGSSRSLLTRPRSRSAPTRNAQSRRKRTEAVSLLVQALVTYPQPSTSALQCLLRKKSRWEFDPFLLNRISDEHPIQTLGPELFQANGLHTVFQLDWTSLLCCLRLIENGYYNNRFHNAMHAADVAQALHCFIQEDLVSQMLSPMEKMACILAAFGHDLFHPGVNQKFHENTGHYLCPLYNNVSVLENFHWRCLVSVLIESRLLAHFSTEEWRKLLRILELLILATDMQRQQEYLNQFQIFLRRSDSTAQSHGSNLRLMQPEATDGNQPPEGLGEEGLFILQILIKCADINNPCRVWSISQEWSLRASAEFFNQGDLEREMGLPVTSFCDRYATSVSKIQSGFMEFVAKPLFSDWEQYIGSPLATKMLNHLRSNCARWTEDLQKEVDVTKAVDIPNTSAASEEGTSSLEEVAAFEVQHPEVLMQRRRVSASVLLTTPYRKPSLYRSRGKESRRVSLPAKMSSSTMWTIETPQRGVFETTSMELLADSSVALMPPSEATVEWQASNRVLPDLVEVLSTASAVTTPRSPQQKSEDPPPPASFSPSRAKRRYSEPVIPSFQEVQPNRLPPPEPPTRQAKGGRRSSLPVSNNLGISELQWLREGAFSPMCSSTSSGSELLQPVGAF